MHIRAKSGKIDQESTDAIIIYLFQDMDFSTGPVSRIDTALDGAIRELYENNDFNGKKDQKQLLYTHGKLPTKRILLIGLGAQDQLTLDTIRKTASNAATYLRDHGIKSVSTTIHAPTSTAISRLDQSQALVEGVLLGTYQFTEFKTIDTEKIKTLAELTIIEEDDSKLEVISSGMKIGESIAHATNWTRDLISHPGNSMTPTILADTTKNMAESLGLDYCILSMPEIEEIGMGSFIGVAKGSQEPAKFIIVEYNRDNPDLDTIVIVGKGITFDSGGISIKPGQGMELMKTDMSGAAAVLGVIQAVAKLNLPIHLVALAPATENLPSGTAIKPGDVLKSLSGKTIEIISTDAEGRLILADALAYVAKHYKPDAIIDIATLTGACMHALGPFFTGLMSQNENLVEDIEDAAKRSGDRVWRLPLDDDYKAAIKSDVADLCNIGSQKYLAGATTAAHFLQVFVGDIPWAHLDIAGTAFNVPDMPYFKTGATGAGVRLLIDLAMHWK